MITASPKSPFDLNSLTLSVHFPVTLPQAYSLSDDNSESQNSFDLNSLTLSVHFPVTLLQLRLSSLSDDNGESKTPLT